MSRERAIWLRVALLATLFLLGLSSLASADFLTFHGDNQRTGNLSGKGSDAPNLLWSTSLTGHGYIGGVAGVSGDRVFVSNWPDMNFKGNLGFACLDREKGAIIWINPLGGKGGASTPAISGDKVFIGSYKGDLCCLNAATGETVWNTSLDKNPQ
ncbi:MAG: PQQ-binding-like beta-propeller repeat protein [Methanotrichaceae archaeon]